MRVRTLTGLLAAGALLCAAAAPAAADPKGEQFDLVCDNGQTYSVVTSGNGDFTPAHDSESTTTFVPLSFGEFTGTVRDAQGNVVDTITEPGVSKGQSGKNATGTLSCTFSFTGTEDGLTFEAHGSVVGYATPRKRGLRDWTPPEGVRRLGASRRTAARPAGFEPATSRSGGERSIP